MESMPTMIAQASKKQRCMNIELETGTAQYVEEDSCENEERVALSDLGLWKYAGYDSIPSFLSVNGSKIDASDLTNPESELNGELKVEAIRQKSIQNSHKGYMECSLLLGMTDLINNQEYLTLQTCSRPAILPRGIALPPGQVVEIRRKEYSLAENVIVSGLTAATKVMSERRVFAKGVLEVRKNWRVLSHSAILATKKHLQQRVVQLDGKERDTLYIDCSYVSSGDKLSNLDEFLVPLDIGQRGLILGGDEKEIICKTLKITMKLRSTGETIASATSWCARKYGPPKNILDSSAEGSSGTIPDMESYTEVKVDGDEELKAIDSEECVELDRDFMPRINAHCERRQHDAMSKRLFARLRKAAVEDHDRLIIQSEQNSDPNSRSENLNKKRNKKLEIFSALFEGAVLGSLEVCRVEKGQIAVNITDDLSILINLEPIPNCTDENSSRWENINENDNEKKNDKKNQDRNIFKNHEMSIPGVEHNHISSIEGDKMIVDDDASESCDDRKWLTDLFSCSLIKAQLLLLEHWTSSLEVETERKEKELATAAATAAAAAAALVLSSNKLKSMSPISTASVSANSSNKQSTESTVQDPEKNSFEFCSASLLGVDVSKRLVDSVLRSRVRDVGDGIALSINRSQVLGEVAQPDKNMKMKDFSIQNSTVSVNRTDLGSSSGKILLGLLDVIRCGIQRYRVCKILKSMESEICDYLKVDMTYDYFPTKFEDKKSEEVVKTEIQAIPNVKIKTEIKSESKSDSEGKNETEDEDKNDNDNDNDKSDDNENEEKVIKLVNGTVGEKVVVKNEICNEEEKKIKEEIDRIELEKIKKIEMEKELQIVREKKSIFLKEFLSSDRAVFLVTLPDSYLLITASPRYGFEIKSVVCNEEPNPFSHFIQIQDANGKKNRIRSESVAQAAAGDRSTETSNNTHTTATRNDSKHTPPCMYHPCESLFHPMSVRVDLTQQLVRSLKSVVLGSYLRCSTALKGVRERTCVYVTQISPTLFSLSHQSPRTEQGDRTYGAYGHDSDKMDCVLSPEPSREGQQLDGVVGQSIEFIATVRIRLRECSGAGGEGGEGGGALANGVQGGEGAGAGGGREGGSSSGEESSPAVTITVDFELYSDFTDILTEFNRILSAHGNTAIQSNSTDRKIVFDCVERGALSYFSSFIESLCVVFPRPVSVFET